MPFTVSGMQLVQSSSSNRNDPEAETCHRNFHFGVLAWEEQRAGSRGSQHNCNPGDQLRNPGVDAFGGAARCTVGPASPEF